MGEEGFGDDEGGGGRVGGLDGLGKLGGLWNEGLTHVAIMRFGDFVLVLFYFLREGSLIINLANYEKSIINSINQLIKNCVFNLVE